MVALVDDMRSNDVFQDLSMRQKASLLATRAVRPLSSDNQPPRGSDKFYIINITYINTSSVYRLSLGKKVIYEKLS